MDFSIKDSYRTAVELASGGRSTVMYDDQGNPNIMVCIPRYYMADIGLKNVEGYHPAFDIGNGKEIKEIWVSKYCGLPGEGGVPVSMRTDSFDKNCMYADLDTARNLCAKKGRGWHLISNIEWAAVWVIADHINYLPYMEDFTFKSMALTNTHDGNGVYWCFDLKEQFHSFELVDGMRIEGFDMIHWWGENGIPNNDFINRKYTDSMIQVDSDDGSTYGKIHYYRVYNETGEGNPRCGGPRSCNFQEVIAYKNDVSRPQDADYLKAAGLVPTNTWNKWTWGVFARVDMGQVPYYIARGGGWQQGGVRVATPLNYDISYTGKEQRRFRAVYIAY